MQDGASGSPTWGQHGQALNGENVSSVTELCHLVFSRSLQLQLSPGLGWVQPGVSIAGVSSAWWGHHNLCKHIKKAFYWCWNWLDHRNGVSCTPSFSSLVMHVGAPEWSLWGRHTQMFYLWAELFLFPHETECSGIKPVGIVKTDQSSLLWGMVSIHERGASCMPPCSSVASQSKPENASEGDVLLIFRYEQCSLPFA